MLDSTSLWTVAHQAPLSLGFSRQEYWSGLPCPPSGNLPNPGIELSLLHYRLILYHWATRVFLLLYIKIFSWITAVHTLVSSSKLWTLGGQSKHLTSFWFSTQHKGLPLVKNLPADAGDMCQEDAPWQSAPVFLPGKSHGQRSLTRCGPWDYRELDTTKQPSTHTCTHVPTQQKILKFSTNFWIELWWLHHTISIRSVLLVW